jgi:recombination protein RecT
MTPERLLRIALTECRRTPKLAECSQASLLSSIFSCAQLGLEPGGSLGHAYLVPFGREVQFILGYRGMIDLARRSGLLESISSHAVFEGDQFDCELGLDNTLKHKPDWSNPNRTDPGKLLFVYAVAKLKDGGHQFEVMSRQEVDQIRRRSKGGASGPWVSDFVAMALKTVVRRLFKWLPVSIELAKAVGMDEQAEFGLSQDSDLVLEVEQEQTVSAEVTVIEPPSPSPSADLAPLSDEQLGMLQKAVSMRLSQDGHVALLSGLGVADLGDLPAERFDEVMRMLANKETVDGLNATEGGPAS